MQLFPRNRLGVYEIEEMIGAGGMGEVYRATDTQLKRPVAIKVLPVSLSSDPDRLVRFQREAEILAALNHPHIAQIYGLEKSEGVTALVLELVEGPTLVDLIGRGPLPIEEVCRIGAQIASALEAAHDRGIIHRDLKPANIKLTNAGEVKVLDFGLAKIGDALQANRETGLTMTASAPATEVGVVMGTLPYMSPEQLSGAPLDRRSDIWAFGCVLYELLTGHHAFSTESVAGVTGGILGAAVDWSRIPSKTPATIVALLRRCLERDPRKRLRDVGEARIVLDDPDKAWRMEPTPSPATTRGRGLRYGVAGLLLGLVIALAVFSQKIPWSAQTPSHRPMQFRISLAPAERLPVTSSFSRPSEPAVAISRDGQIVVFAGERVTDSGAQGALFRRPIDEPSASPIAGTEGAHTGFLSPDGAWVGFISGGAVRRVQIAGGTPNEICAVNLDAFGGKIVGASWGDDGTIVLGSQAGPLRRVAATGGTPSEITSFASDTSDYSHRLPHHLPDGRGVIFTSIADPLGDAGRIYVLPAGGRQPRLLLEDSADARYVGSGHLVFIRRGVLMAVRFDLDKVAVSGNPQAVVHAVMQSFGSDNPWWNSRAGQFDLSDTGTLVYASGGVYPPIINRLLWLNRNGQTEPIGEPGRSLLGPRISPDGKQIVVGQMSDPKQPLRVYDVRRQLWTSWTNVTGQVAFPVWTRDGQQIVFTWFNEGRSGIHIGSLDGSRALRHLTSGPRPRVASDVSADGWLAFVEDFTLTRMDIWVMRLDGSGQPRPVVQNPGDDRQPAFSPDGRWLAYSSDVSGSLEVYVVAFPGPGPRIQVSSGGGVGAVWARDQRTLYYVKHTGREGMLMEVSVQTTPALSAGAPRAVTRFPYLVSGPARTHDVAPDGQRFVVTTYDQPGGAPATELHVLVNWPERLNH